MNQESSVLRIVKEDVLRILGEGKGRASLETIQSAIKASNSFVFTAFKKLEKENQIQIEESTVKLTESGKEKADDICRKHNILEEYFYQPKKKSKEVVRGKKTAHEAAHLLEHHISEQVLDNIKKLLTLREEGVPLSAYKRRKGMITDLLLDDKMFERLISMGFSPGENMEIKEILPNAIVIKIKNKKFAIDREIAGAIRILEKGKLSNPTVLEKHPYKSESGESG